jgi:pimeloyl-ACP methyl ester carboxylesterase
MRISLRGLTFDVQVAGPAEGEPVLLLHGFPQHAGEWEQVGALLHAHGYRTVAPDQRGYSRGARPTEVSAYRIGEAVADALALLDERGMDTAHLVGHDWGAVVGWHLAGRYPDRVRTFTAVSVPHPHAVAEAVRDDEDQRERSRYIELFRQPGKAEEVLLEDDGARLRRMLAGCPPERIADYVTPMLDPDALTAALNWYRAMGPDEAGPLGRVAVPTTFVWGDRDTAIGPVAAERCGEYVTGQYRFLPLPGASHWIPDELPGEVAEAVMAGATVK